VHEGRGQLSVRFGKALACAGVAWHGGAVVDPGSGDVVYGRMRWNAPLSEDHAELLLERLAVAVGDEVLDLGCGWGELLLRTVVDKPDAKAVAVDSDAWALQRGRNAAVLRGLSERVTFVTGDISTWVAPADRVLCVGACHAWGGSAEALKALCRVVRPGGRILVGDEYWERSPSDRAAAFCGAGVLPLSGLVEAAVTAGWRVIHLSTADLREWDDFESTWRAGRLEWLLDNPDDERAVLVGQKLEEQLREYVDCYRGVLGFAYLVLTS